MNLKKVRTQEHRIGVVGLYRSGKTVFTTSLIDHLRFQDPQRFPLADDAARIRQFSDEGQQADAGWDWFEYRKYRDRLTHSGEWPEKTKARLQYACEFERTDRRRWQRVKLYDFPGERIADAAMYSLGYDAWSDFMLAHLDADTKYKNEVQEFLDLQTIEGVSEDVVLTTYKKALAQLALAYKALISPSVFLLDTHGDSARPAPVEDLVRTRRVGLEGEEFAPMRESFRENHPDLRDAFEQRYKEYRKKIVRPWVRGLRRCHSLAVLVDITMVLAGGQGMYHDNQYMIRKLLRIIGVGESIIGHVGKGIPRIFLPAKWRPGGISKIAFLASKSDKVLDIDTYKHLLKSMVRRDADNLDGVETAYFSCSAVKSTEVLDTDSRTMCARLHGLKSNPSEKRKFKVPQLPEDWPLQWNGDDYRFPRVDPMMPPRKDYPPEHDNLDKVFAFLTD